MFSYNCLASSGRYLKVSKKVILLIFFTFYFICFFLVNCVVSQWSSCSKTCGPGTQQRSIQTPANYGGLQCPSQLTKSCSLKNCPGQSQSHLMKKILNIEDLKIFSYNCLASSGRYLKVSKKVILLIFFTFYFICFFLVNCVVSQWSSCSKTCGPGTQQRSVQTPANYGGLQCPSQLTKSCSLKNCPGQSQSNLIKRLENLQL